MARELLERLIECGSLGEVDLQAVFDLMLGGQLTEAQTAAFLACWRLRGEGALELTVGARAMRQRATKVPLPEGVRPLVDNCGTGGDGSNSFNISTASAIVAASVGVKVAKHGNRSVSSKCGSADLLFAAGFPQEITAEAAGKLLGQTGFTFFFAPNFHPAMKHVMPVRRSLGMRTIFNLLGPLANPIAPESQLIGVGAKELIHQVAEALQNLGVKQALVVHSRDGLDEVSPCAPTDAVRVNYGRLESLVIDPSAYGIKAELKDLAGGDAAINFGILAKVLNGDPCGAAEAVALNAGALLWTVGASGNLKDGISLAKKQLSNLAAREFFQAWIAAAADLKTQAK